MGTQVPSGEPSAIPVPVADGGTGIAGRASASHWTAANAHWGLVSMDQSGGGIITTFPGWRAGILRREA